MTTDDDPAAVWRSEFGEDWTERHPVTVSELDEMYTDHYGITRTVLNKLFLASLDREAS